MRIFRQRGKGHPIDIEHSTKGPGKMAYQNWKKTNVSLRDQSHGQLGPLTRHPVSVPQIVRFHSTISRTNFQLEITFERLQ